MLGHNGRPSDLVRSNALEQGLTYINSLTFAHIRQIMFFYVEVGFVLFVGVLLWARVFFTIVPPSHAASLSTNTLVLTVQHAGQAQLV